MTDAELSEFLDAAGTGVLSLAADDTPYSIPVSYGFEPSERRFYLRLGFGPDSEKSRFVDDAGEPTARLVVYDRVGDEWHSAVAEGPLTEVDDEEIDLTVVRTLRRAALPVRAAFDVPEAEVEFRMFALDPTVLTGRRAPTDGGE
jgi:hypothetical protein